MKVFVSSTYEDLKEYRQAVRDAILGLKNQPLMMEHFITEGEPPNEECLKRVEESDVVIGIYAYRYGSIPPGEKISVTEQEYWHAVKKKKRIFCFLLHSDADWPEKFRDDTPKLKEFRGRILTDHYVKFFKSPAELRSLVTEALASLMPLEIESVLDRVLEDAREKSESIDAKRKLKLIDGLVTANENKMLNNEALISSVKLIASDFTAFNPSLTPKIIHYTKNLLVGHLRINEFIELANKFTQKLKLRNFIKKFAVLSVLFVIAGLVLGIFSYRFDWFNARSTYLAGRSSDSRDVVKWLINKVDEMNESVAANPKNLQAIIALGFAYEIDPKDRRIYSYLEDMLRTIRKNASRQDIALEQLISNKSNLDEISNFIEYEPINELRTKLNDRIHIVKDSTDAIHLLANLKLQEQDSTMSDTLILKGYRNLFQKYQRYIDNKDIEPKTNKFENTVTDFQHLKAISQADTATINEKLQLWKKFHDTQRSSPEKSYARSEVTKLNEHISEFASISDENKFITCKNVVELNPQGKSIRFSGGNICAWAQVHAPRSEQVYFKWYANGEHYHTFSVRVDRNLEPGYRVHSAKNYSSEYTGKQEVRLYNSQNQLIGRRVFYVG